MSQKLTKCFWFATEKRTWEIVVDANGLSVFDLLATNATGTAVLCSEATL